MAFSGGLNKGGIPVTGQYELFSALPLDARYVLNNQTEVTKLFDTLGAVYPGLTFMTLADTDLGTAGVYRVGPVGTKESTVRIADASGKIVVGTVAGLQTALDEKSPKLGSSALITTGTVTAGTWSSTVSEDATIKGGAKIDGANAEMTLDEILDCLVWHEF